MGRARDDPRARQGARRAERGETEVHLPRAPRRRLLGGAGQPRHEGARRRRRDPERCEQGGRVQAVRPRSCGRMPPHTPGRGGEIPHVHRGGEAAQPARPPRRMDGDALPHAGRAHLQAGEPAQRGVLRGRRQGADQPWLHLAHHRPRGQGQGGHGRPARPGGRVRRRGRRAGHGRGQARQLRLPRDRGTHEGPQGVPHILRVRRALPQGGGADLAPLRRGVRRRHGRDARRRARGDDPAASRRGGQGRPLRGQAALALLLQRVRADDRDGHPAPRHHRLAASDELAGATRADGRARVPPVAGDGKT